MESYNAKKGIDFTRGQAMENVNISTIAQEAGVSQATVSRVLNNSGYVSIKAKNKVNRVIEKYGYAPSALARHTVGPFKIFFITFSFLNIFIY